jgi:hypothetical protein
MKNSRKSWAVVNDPGPGIAIDGPAFGVGRTPEAAERDARRWNEGEDPEETQTIEITYASYKRVKNGNPDAWEPA